MYNKCMLKNSTEGTRRKTLFYQRKGTSTKIHDGKQVLLTFPLAPSCMSVRGMASYREDT